MLLGQENNSEVIKSLILITYPLNLLERGIENVVNSHCTLFLQLVNVGEEVLVFYSDPQSFNSLVDMMQGERERLDESGPLLYHINLVELLACCTEGKNVYTEIKCHSLLPLDDIVRVVTHPDCISEVRGTGDNGACSMGISRQAVVRFPCQL